VRSDQDASATAVPQDTSPLPVRLDRITSGRYFLESIDVSSHNKKSLALIRNQKIGFVFQGFNLLARTTALENTELPALYTKVDKAERRKRAADALAMVGLAERAHHFPSQMSGGTATTCCDRSANRGDARASERGTIHTE
jgi:ABC-type lipoprotein export system ATPase subunit